MQASREYQALLYACTQEGCSLCRLVHESTQRYLDTWAYDLFTDVELRDELRRSQGFCHNHTWQLARMGASLQLAQTYRAILSDTIDHLQNATGENSQQLTSGFLRRLFETKRDRPACPACQQREKTEQRIIHTLRVALLDPDFYAPFAASQGLCLEHFRLASELKMTNTPGEWLPLLRQAQLAALQRLDEQLGELIRKHDYHFKDELRGSEMLSWKKAAGLVAGEENH